MTINILLGALLPFMGTALGAAGVFFMRGEMNARARSAVIGFAAGIMVAASVWSLILPAVARAAGLGRFAFVPAAVGLLCGVFFLLLLDLLASRLCAKGESRSRLTMAVTLHNLPEGMAVGAVLAGLLAGEEGITVASALALSLGIAIQNFPEGAIISMPEHSRGYARGRAFLHGVLSGAVEPLGALMTILAAGVIVPALPYLLGFAAGAMICVVVEELIPELAESGHLHLGSITFSFGFTLMMILDIALG